ncbi:hypothetical protein lerEdw1_002757 [Lerista edwardsae]|nr:hypothetical protein lerEdw1_002757 [Lerista edwardsae]
MTLCTEAAAGAALDGSSAGSDMLQQRVFTLPRQTSFYPPSVLNPFVQERCLGAKDKSLALLFGLILVPLRVLGMLLILLVAWPFALLATSCHSGKGVAPLLGWKRAIAYPVLTFLGHALFFVMGFRVKVKGKVASPQEAPILAAAPHSSFFDGIVCVLAGLPSTVSRLENLSAPLLGRILSALQPVVVSRVDPDSRKNTINEITRRATSGEQWPQVLIFPEGTCTNRSCLITFKQGAFIPAVPVQPVVIRYPNKLDTVTWTWQGYDFKEALVLTLCQPFTKVEVEFLPVHVPTEEEKKDPILFASRVRNEMASALDVPVTDHTYEDCRLMISAGQLTLPMEAGLVEFTKVSKKLNLKWDNIREQLDQFAAIARASKGGRIGIQEFADHLKLPVSDVLKELFALFDRVGFLPSFLPVPRSLLNSPNRAVYFAETKPVICSTLSQTRLELLGRARLSAGSCGLSSDSSACSLLKRCWTPLAEGVAAAVAAAAAAAVVAVLVQPLQKGLEDFCQEEKVAAVLEKSLGDCCPVAAVAAAVVAAVAAPQGISLEDSCLEPAAVAAAVLVALQGKFLEDSCPAVAVAAAAVVVALQGMSLVDSCPGPAVGKAATSWASLAGCHFANVQANESEEVRQFRRLFAQVAGDDMEVCPTELMNILNKVLARHQDLRTEDGFSLDTCRSMVAVMDSDTTGKLDFYQFRYLWNNIKKWQHVFKQHRSGPSGPLQMAQLPAAFKGAGFHLHDQLYALIIRRYAEEDGSMDFNNFISCLVRLDSMFRAFKSLDRAGDGKVQMNLQDWLQLTMYS